MTGDRQPTSAGGPGLTLRFGLAVVGFVVVGSLLLLTWLGRQQAQQAERLFTSLAKTDADFIRELHLPRSDKLAADLSRLLKMEVHFRHRDGTIEPQPVAAVATDLAHVSVGAPPVPVGGNRQALAVRIDDQYDALFVRDPTPSSASLTQPSTLGALGVFWLLSLALAWAVTRDVVRPIAQLAKRLPQIFGDTPARIPETERRDEIGQLARSLIEARDQLSLEREKRERSERLALLGRVATGLAHEIKNPVASICLHSQLMDHGKLDAEAKRSLDLIQGESRVIEGLVNQWLYLARPEPPKMTPLDLREVMSQAIDTLRAQATHAGVTIVATLNDPLPVRGDRQRLTQVIRNLALNAIQAMPIGGTLMIEGGRTGNTIQMSFTDSGPGFSKQALEHGADLFFSEREGGLGIGLNVAKEVIAHHHGTLRLSNVEPRGGRVTVSLPASG